MTAHCEQETPGEANPIEQEILSALNDILAGKDDSSYAQMESIMDSNWAKAEQNGLDSKLEPMFKDVLLRCAEILKKENEG